MKELEARDTWFGLLGGGGAGACTLTRRLEERERVESCDDRLTDVSTSSESEGGALTGAGAGAVTMIEALLSDLPWGCRLAGGGGGFLGVGDTGVTDC